MKTSTAFKDSSTLPAWFSDWVNDFQPISYIPQIHTIIEFASVPDIARLENAFRPHWVRLSNDEPACEKIQDVQKPPSHAHGKALEL